MYVYSGDDIIDDWPVDLRGWQSPVTG
jgi:hypothetical protein